MLACNQSLMLASEKGVALSNPKENEAEKETKKPKKIVISTAHDSFRGTE